MNMNYRKTPFTQLLLAILFLSGTFGCQSYKQSFKKKDISTSMKIDEQAYAESKFTTYDASNITIGNLEWKGSAWDKKYEYGKDPMFRYTFPWDQEKFKRGKDLPYQVYATFNDITKLKTAEDQQQLLNDELKRSNRDLEEFTYVVSHDLKEPLRKIKSYGEFLFEDYSDKIDGDGIFYIERSNGCT